MEYKKEISIAGTIAVIAALGVGLIALTYFPSGAPSVIVPSTTSGVITPRLLLGYVSATNVTCSLTSGVCTTTLVNNATVPFTIDGCQMILYTIKPYGANGENYTTQDVNGTVGGSFTEGVPAANSYSHGSVVSGSCTIPTSNLSGQTAGSIAEGILTVRLTGNWYSVPAGKTTTIYFEGAWSWSQTKSARVEVT